MSGATRFALAAAACALLAGWLTFSYTGAAADRDGPAAPALVTTRPLARGAVFGPGDAAAFTLRRIPARYTPPGALTAFEDAAGRRLQADLPAGSFVTDSLLAGAHDSSGEYPLRAGERALTVEASVSPSGHELSAGDRVDLFASGFGGDQRTVELIGGAEVLAVEDGASAARPRATLRLASGQVAAVVRADVFAHELRAVIRP